jgi:hypothetical protein
MTLKVFALDTKPGIQRDGTLFDKLYYTDGRWVRFQRGRPRKIGGYSKITGAIRGPVRGMFVNPQGALNNVFTGYSGGLQKTPVDNSGVGSGVSDITLTSFTANANNLWQFDSFTDTLGSGLTYLLAHPGQNLADLNSSVNTPVLAGDITGSTLGKIGTFTESVSLTTGLNTGTVATANPLIGAGQTVGPTANFAAGTTVVSVVGTTITFSTNALTTGSATLTFDNNVSVSGGVVVLHPYVFVYGNNGLIRNCSSGNFQDWVTADANEVNVATGKIVQGLPVRGGSNSPSGLFWSLDSLVRVSYAPTSITAGATTITQYWRYDIISTQSSIMSSQCVIEYDGIYYWCGVDRFLLYNGVVKEIPNPFNQNYFFDNLNYTYREKVWVTKVPRFGEVWWFFPNGSSATECNDAVIYNIRENCWYDVGTAVGARRSAGYFSQVFARPIEAGNEITLANGIESLTITNPGAGYTNGTYNNQALTGGTGTGATANIIVAGGVITSAVIYNPGQGYTVGDVLSAAIPAGAGLVLTVATVGNYVTMWQHEYGTDAVDGTTVLAIESYFETNDLGWVSGGPSEPAPTGQNNWLHLERVEPDFVLSGEMNMYVAGRSYAQGSDDVTGPYTFDSTTTKIDLREQRRELRLKFVSNVAGGNYQLGKLLLSADLGDVRGYS